MTDSPVAAPPSERLHALDAVRAFALTCGVLFHATMSFLPGPQIWIVADSRRSTALAVLFFVLHVFRMVTFFLLAGFFGRMLLERRGVRGFIRDRLIRIAGPLFALWFPIFAAIVAVVIWAAAKANGGHLPAGPPPRGPSFTPTDFPLTHLWFLWVLLLLYAAALLARGIVGLDRSGAVMRGVDRFVRLLVRLPSPVLLAAPLFALFVATPSWLGWFGIPTPDQSLIPNPIATLAFGLAFTLGWLVQRQPDLLGYWRRHWASHVVMAVVFVTACLAIAGPAPLLTPDPNEATRWAYAACYAMAIWSSCFAVIGLGLRFADGHSARRRYLADASYWIYLMHLPLVMALQVAVSDLAWPWPVKYAAVVGGAFVILLASYRWLVRGSFIGRWLNGRAYPARSRQPGTP